jgi:hypothetical protein
LARQYGINPKTVAKRKDRSDVKDQPMGPKQPRSSVLDDCLYALQDTIPHLTRSSLHRLEDVRLEVPEQNELMADRQAAVPCHASHARHAEDRKVVVHWELAKS